MSSSNSEILFKKFEIISCYKKDEYSAVYLANHIYLEKKVFLKILNTETIPDSTVIERFKIEAKILAQLEHPNIIKVFDFGMFKEYFYISFEHFESKNLRELLNTQKISEETKKEIFIQLVKGLNFAHQKNIIHRDIKPENILVNENNKVKLTDFGLAQDSLKNSVTQKYSVVGTPAYMAPEQIQGEKPTKKSDLFSLGITAYELFGGKNPFLGVDANETINNIISFDEKDNKELFLIFTGEIKNVLKGLLARNPNNRFNSCSEILKILNADAEVLLTSSGNTNKKLWLAAVIIGVFVFVIWIIRLIFQPAAPVKSVEVNKKTPGKVETIVDTLNNKDNIYSAENVLPIEPKELKSKTNKISEVKINRSKANNIESESINIEVGKLYVKCYPWAKVYLNNLYVETTPLTKNITANVGNYLLTLIHPDYPKYSDSIKISANELSFVEVNLDTLFGYFYCRVYPWSEIYIDGEKKGITPLETPIKLTEGKYNLALVNPQYERIETLINIKRNDTLNIKFTLRDKKLN